MRCTTSSAAEGGTPMMERPVTAREMGLCPSFARLTDAARRQRFRRFVTLHGLEPIEQRGERGEYQFEFADIVARLSAADRDALIQARFAPPVKAAPAPTPKAVTPSTDAQIGALSERWEGASDKSRARAERHVGYVREVAALQGCETPRVDRELKRACKAIAARHRVDWFTIKRACIKVEGRPPELWASLLLDKNCGRSRHEYGSEWDRYFRSYYLFRTAPTASASLDLACQSITKMKDARTARLAGLRVPTVTALLDRLRAELSDEAILLARCGVDAVNARHYQTRDYSSLVAGEALNGDGHYLNWWAVWPDGHQRKPVLFAFQCMYSNVISGWNIDRTENQDSVRLAADEAVCRALPRVVFLDNGRAGASKWLTGGVGLGRRFRFQVKVEDAIGVFRLLGIDVRFTNPYAGRSKKIEKFWGELESRLRARPEPELRRAYAGNGKDAPADNYCDHPVPIELLIRIVGEEIAAYNSRGPNELWDRSVASGAELGKITKEQRRLLLLAAQKIRVHRKDGCIHLFRNRYQVIESPTAVEEGRRIIPGADYTVRFNPARLHDDFYIYDREGRALGSARCVAPVGFSDHAAARETARLNAARRRALRAELEAQRLIDGIELAGTLPQIEPAAPAAGKVSRLFRSPIEAPRATEPAEVFDSSLDIYDDEQSA
jgi:putative transposase